MFIPCTGNGQRRFKFIQVDETLVVNPANATQKPTAFIKLGRLPLSSDVTSLASSFVFGLEVKDPRFDLACYGTFFSEIPKRLGSHPSLDACTSALISAYPAVYTRKPSYEALTRYGRALHALRLSLDKLESDKIVEVLCAIYFLLICQVCSPTGIFHSLLTIIVGLDYETGRRDDQSRKSYLAIA
jgi:hypothetical protein